MNLDFIFGPGCMFGETFESVGRGLAKFGCVFNCRRQTKVLQEYFIPLRNDICDYKACVNKSASHCA